MSVRPDVALIETLAHNTWANLRLIEVSATLPDEQLDATEEGTFGGIRHTLVHVIAAEERYLQRLTGEQPEPPLREVQSPSFDLLRERAGATGRRFQAVVAADEPERVVRWVTNEGESAAMPVALFLVQAIHHGNEHRSQVATVLTHVGVEPPELSGWLYAMETGALTGVKP